MLSKDASPKTVDEYFKGFSSDVLARLTRLRELAKTTCPEAVELMSYGMPAYKYKGRPLIYFAAFPKHIGVYATPTAHVKFSKMLTKYKQGKGSVQFPLDQDLPVEMIREMIEFNVQEIDGQKVATVKRPRH